LCHVTFLPFRDGGMTPPQPWALGGTAVPQARRPTVGTTVALRPAPSSSRPVLPKVQELTALNEWELKCRDVAPSELELSQRDTADDSSSCYSSCDCDSLPGSARPSWARSGALVQPTYDIKPRVPPLKLPLSSARPVVASPIPQPVLQEKQVEVTSLSVLETDSEIGELRLQLGSLEVQHKHVPVRPPIVVSSPWWGCVGQDSARASPNVEMDVARSNSPMCSLAFASTSDCRFQCAVHTNVDCNLTRRLSEESNAFYRPQMSRESLIQADCTDQALIASQDLERTHQPVEESKLSACDASLREHLRDLELERDAATLRALAAEEKSRRHALESSAKADDAEIWQNKVDECQQTLVACQERERMLEDQVQQLQAENQRLQSQIEGAAHDVADSITREQVLDNKIKLLHAEFAVTQQGVSEDKKAQNVVVATLRDEVEKARRDSTIASSLLRKNSLVSRNLQVYMRRVLTGAEATYDSRILILVICAWRDLTKVACARSRENVLQKNCEDAARSLKLVQARCVQVERHPPACRLACMRLVSARDRIATLLVFVSAWRQHTSRKLQGNRAESLEHYQAEVVASAAREHCATEMNYELDQKVTDFTHEVEELSARLEATQTAAAVAERRSAELHTRLEAEKAASTDSGLEVTQLLAELAEAKADVAALDVCCNQNEQRWSAEWATQQVASKAFSQRRIAELAVFKKRLQRTESISMLLKVFSVWRVSYNNIVGACALSGKLSRRRLPSSRSFAPLSLSTCCAAWSRRAAVQRVKRRSKEQLADMVPLNEERDALLARNAALDTRLRVAEQAARTAQEQRREAEDHIAFLETSSASSPQVAMPELRRIDEDLAALQRDLMGRGVPCLVNSKCAG